MVSGALTGMMLCCVSAAGMIQAGLGLAAVDRFARAGRGEGAVRGVARPAITVLKPLHGDEPLLEAALETFFTQDYPEFQIVFGVQSPTDPAIAVVRALRQRYPGRDVALVIDGARHGANHKISNLVNMLPSAKHDVLVMADSDVHAAPDYLNRLVAALMAPGVGVATTLYAGRPAQGGLPGLLGAGHISHVFLPGALLARWLGRQDCLGATMALRRATLEAIGGLSALVNHLADDAMLGRLVRRAGYSVRLASTVPATTVPEASVGALVQHELRWARTIRSVEPLGHALSVVQFPIAWALAAVVASGGAAAAWMVAGAAWAVRAGAAAGMDARLGLARQVPAWALPLRDVLSVAVIVASYWGGQVRWRGQVVPVGRAAYQGRAGRALRLPAREPVLGKG